MNSNDGIDSELSKAMFNFADEVNNVYSESEERTARIAELEAENARLRELAKMPETLTAKNGAKALLIGEFFEEVEIPNPAFCGCGQDDCNWCREGLNDDEPEEFIQKVPVTWDTIKAIYKKIWEHYAAESALEGK